ncbi:MAG: hypothetical protein QOH58_3325 [Thermoleophilaceae bacterium]|jgi:hypothetical protein|nr:hypothetical protein [Thermoleophilaceae bacterium]
MTKKADFNAEEWTRIIQGPALAGMLVATADRGGTLRESLSMAKAYTEAKEEQGASELLDELLSTPPVFDRDDFPAPERMREDGLQRLREAVELLEGKATEAEVDDYRRFVMAVAERAAQAHREGGFLGVGGKEVSESEQAVLDEIAAALGVQRDSAAAGPPQ